MLLQALVSFGSFVLTPILYLTWVERRPLSDLNPNKYLSWTALLLVVVLVIAFIPFNDLIIQWNNSVDLPKFLQPVEQWMREKEDSLRELTQLLTGFQGLNQLALGLLVIAIIPAVGEELLFRGLLQNKLLAVTRNVHVSIWLAALVFSAIHLQFLGFFPRMLLGALFGYLYIWSGNLWIPILAHFINNSFTLVMMYLYQQKMSDYNAESDQTISWPLALLSLALVLSILFYLKNYWRAHSRQLISNPSGDQEPVNSPRNE
jgi:membrane protease YdiL (CAAX protease family)